MNEIQEIVYSALVERGRPDMYAVVWEKLHTRPFPTTRKQIEYDVDWALGLDYD